MQVKQKQTPGQLQLVLAAATAACEVLHVLHSVEGGSGRGAGVAGIAVHRVQLQLVCSMCRCGWAVDTRMHAYA